MKKMAALVFVFLSLSFNSSAQIMAENNFTYSDGVTFSVQSILSNATAQYGNGNDNTLYIGKGARFKTALLKFRNESGQDVEIDFKEFYLIDKEGKKYHLHGVAQGMKLSNTLENLKLKLKSGKNKTYIAEFWPAYPKDEPVTMMMVNGNIITFDRR